MKFTIGGIDFNVGRVFLLFMIPLLVIKFFISKENFKIKDRQLKYVMIFYIIWAIYSVISGLWCEDKKMYIITNFYIITGVTAILFFTFCVDIKRNINKYFYLMQIGVIISSVYYFFIKETYIAGFYHNSNDLATAILFLFPITLYLMYNSKNVFSIIYQFVLFIIYYYIFSLNDSRACALGIYTASIMIVALIALKNREVILKNNKLKIITLGLLIIFSIITINSFDKKVGTISKAPVTQTTVQTSNQKRVNLIFNTLEILKKDCNVLRGIGTGNSIHYMKNHAVYDVGEIYSLHNYWLEILLCHGGVIFIGYVIAYIIICRKLLEKIDLSKSLEQILEDKSLVFLFFLLSFIIGSISSSCILTREWMWLLFAIIISYIYSKENKEV